MPEARQSTGNLTPARTTASASAGSLGSDSAPPRQTVTFVGTISTILKDKTYRYQEPY